MPRPGACRRSKAALRVRLDAGPWPTFDRLIDQAKARGLVGDDAHETLHVGRRLRNIQIHATSMTVITPAMAAGMIETSHKLVAELFEEVSNICSISQNDRRPACPNR
jgi:hypothetical protein